MEYRWYKNGHVIVKSGDSELSDVFGITQEYFDGYVGNQTHRKGNLNLVGSGLESLGKLERVDGNLNLHGSKITSLGKIMSVGGGIVLSRTGITSLGKLEYVGGDLYIRDTNLTSLGNLDRVGGVIYCTRDSSTLNLLSDSKFKDQVRIF